MIAGYLRLSRDEDKKQYVSIENQKLILNQYAASHGLKIDVFYEDDNISGYTLERPGMKKLMRDIDAGFIYVVMAKDLSRIGRHNAKVLLMIEDFKERGIRLILVNDNYDSFYTEEDDILGIKTWYNERYVKDTSKKMKRVLRARQKEGTLAARPCFGYEVSGENKCALHVVEREARTIRKIFDLYLEGNGYRRTAEILNEEKIPTPSASMKQRGSKGFHGIESLEWSSEMIRDILKNDCYTGKLRTHVRERKTIHGTDLRVPKEEQFVFENHHAAIIDEKTFQMAQETMEKRIRNHYRGQRSNYSIFSQCIFCRDCGGRMNLVRRKRRKQQTYFICRTYNAKGRKYCSAHSVDEDVLMEAVLHYLQICREMLHDDIIQYTLEKREERNQQDKAFLKEMDAQLYKEQRRLEMLISQKIDKMAEPAGDVQILETVYGKLEKEILGQIKRIQEQMLETEKEIQERKDGTGLSFSAVDVLDRIIAGKELTAKDVELLIDKIIVDQDGSFEIRLRHGIASMVDEKEVVKRLESKKDIFKDVLTVVLEEADSRGYTSAKNMNRKLREMGWPVSVKSVASFLEQLSDMGMIEKTDNRLKPYKIIAGRDDIRRRLDPESRS